VRRRRRRQRRCLSGDLGGTGPQAAALAVVVPTQTEAARFLTQATFGPTSAEIQRLSGMTYAQWIEEQFAKPQTLHRLYMNQAAADLASVGQQLSRTNFFDSYWSQAISARTSCASARRSRCPRSW
jgi:hypothetical protein